MVLGIFWGLLSGLMLIISYNFGYTWFSFICLIPLLYFLAIQNKVASKVLSVFTFLTLWNTYNYLFLVKFLADFVGAYAPAVIIPLVLLQFVPFIPLILNSRCKYIMFCSLWLIQEFALQHWTVSTTFSSIGILASSYYKMFQWMQFTGVLGGSLWILLCNILLIWLLNASRLKKRNKHIIMPLGSLFLLFTPCIYSALMLCQLGPDHTAPFRKVLVFGFNSSETQDSIQRHILGALTEVDNQEQTQYVVLPEFTAWLNNVRVDDAPFTTNLESLLPSYRENVTFIYSVALNAWGKQQALAVALNEKGVQLRNKELLVPFAEYTPSYTPKSIWGQGRGLAANYISKNTEPSFQSYYDTFHVSICYESFFENFLKSRLEKSIGIIFVLAKEPFTINSHYNNMVRLIATTQAITFQKPIIRSSWGGPSLSISSNGEVLGQLANQTGAFLTSTQPNYNPSFYARSHFNYMFYLAILSFAICAKIVLAYKVKPIIMNIGAMNTSNKTGKSKLV